MKIAKNVQRQIDLTDLELVELKMELNKLFAELTIEDQERYPRLKALFELLTEETP